MQILPSLLAVLLELLAIAVIYYAVIGLIKKPEFFSTKINTKNVFKLIAECLFIYVLPGIGIYTTNEKCAEHPFQNDSLPTAYTLWILFVIAYSLSKYFKKQLSPILLLLVSSGLFIGVLYCLTICIHFLPMIPAVILPGFNLLFLSPFFCAAFLMKEIIELNIYFKDYFEKENLKFSEQVLLIYNYIYKHRLSIIIFLMAPLLLIIQSILFLFGQQHDSIITQFTESCGYLLSIKKDCSCGGGHYLCSIAKNGNNKLVKPLRYGTRKNELIVVNRQLLVANAFENWLEEYVPKIHKPIRNFYDAMNIPVDEWSKNKQFANALYILMKPLEWFFLLWLYLFDKNPENRIAKQYFPKNELDMFIANKKI